MPTVDSTSSASLHDALLPLHASPDLKTLLRAAADFASAHYPVTSTRLVLSRGAALPGMLLWIREGTVIETRLDARWIFGPMAESLHGCSAPRLLDPAAGEADGSRLPGALFPGISFQAALAVPLSRGRHDLHLLILAGPAALAGSLEDPRTEIFAKHFRVALERLVDAEREQCSLSALRSFAGNSCTGLVTLNWDLAPCYGNRSALRFCAEWEGGKVDERKNHRLRIALPEAIFQECVRLKKCFLTQGDPGSRNEPSSIVECPGVPGLRAFVRLARSPSPGFRRPYFQIRFERPILPRSPGRGAQVRENIRNLLSPSERELLEVAAGGCSNEEIASRLGKSIATVKSQIQSIYRKLSISNRSELIARLSGFTGSGLAEGSRK